METFLIAFGIATVIASVFLSQVSTLVKKTVATTALIPFVYFDPQWRIGYSYPHAAIARLELNIQPHNERAFALAYMLSLGVSTWILHNCGLAYILPSDVNSWLLSFSMCSITHTRIVDKKSASLDHVLDYFVSLCLIVYIYAQDWMDVTCLKTSSTTTQSQPQSSRMTMHPPSSDFDVALDSVLNNDDDPNNAMHRLEDVDIQLPEEPTD